jgi:hypothetical protein
MVGFGRLPKSHLNPVAPEKRDFRKLRFRAGAILKKDFMSSCV